MTNFRSEQHFLSHQSIFFVQILKTSLALLPVLWRYNQRILHQFTQKRGVIVTTLFVAVFFTQLATRSTPQNHLVTIETVFIPNTQIKSGPLGIATATPIASSGDIEQTTNLSRKKLVAGLANFALLNPENMRIAVVPMAAKVDEADNTVSGYLDTLPSVQGVAFFEGMAPATQSLSERSEIYTYVVEENDTPAGIAELFGISLDTILWANTLTTRSIIKPGDTLVILPVNGVVHVVRKGDTIGSLAKAYSVAEDDVVAYNNLPRNNALEIGSTLVIPDGIKPTPPRIVAVPRPVSITKQTINIPAGWLIQPASGRNWGRLHGFNGVDIANSCGTPLAAAAAGTVVVADDAGWNGGYGKYLKIQHPNGVITLYAHAKELLVDVGADVAQGQTVAFMGTTGRSTGCHVHFEVRGAKNPFVRR